MTIYRGPGGTGTASSEVDTTEYQEFLVQAQAAKEAAEAARDAALAAETNAETAETNASASASAAASSASAAATSASNAATSASSAASSAVDAAASAASVNDTNLVHISGTETITGVKTFSNTIVGSVSGNAATVTNGVITTGSYANPSWLTSLAWSKVTNTPTTIAGYGITNAYTKTEIDSKVGTAGGLGFRNRIINGDMRIDQRNAGASATIGPSTSHDYRVDRFFLQRFGGTATYTGQQSTTAPAGFVNSLSATVAIAATPTTNNSSFIRQLIEGFNVADLGFGTANAQAVTLSFWVRSSITGTHGGSVTNGGFTRSYVFTYSIASANTWEYKTITVPGDTSGTWATDNSAGMRVNFDLGCGPDLNGTAGTWASASVMRTSGCVTWIANSGATFYITGVQLEAGSVASPFERRDYGRELMMCQRYFELATVYSASATGGSRTDLSWIQWQVQKRAQPTLITVSTTSIGGSNSLQTQSSTNGFSISQSGFLLGVISGSSEL